ncbi:MULTISPECIES: flavin reductase family protein [Mumia]|uniref:Flavin reductase family protein n=1 Tax=Mumia xiangluensis TaxID=1678900 RepID=A0ABW1QHW4_9ACTN|nr:MULTISPECIES: flavin reductase family protein [Mumia]
MNSASHPLDPATSRAFRDVLGRFASGVTVVTSVADGVDHAMTASAFTSVSLDPALVLVVVDRRNRFHDAVLDSGTWGVSILSEDGQDDATWLAHRGRPLEDQLARVPHHRGAETGAALLDRGIAWLECTTWQTYDGGDHTIVVGQVLAASVRSDAEQSGLDLDQTRLGEPLLYYRSHYGALVRSPESEKNSGPSPVEQHR